MAQLTTAANTNKAGAEAHRAAQNKTDKYASLASTHIFCPFAIETAGAWHETAIEVTQEIGQRITVVTEDTRETEFLFQRLSMALQRVNAVSFQNTMITEWNVVATIYVFSFNISACGFVLVGPNNNNNNNTC